MSVKPDKLKIAEWIEKTKKRAKRLEEYVSEHKPVWDIIDKNRNPYISPYLVREQQKMMKDPSFA